MYLMYYILSLMVKISVIQFDMYFFIQVTIDRHPVRFFVHKRPHVDFFLDVVRESKGSILSIYLF